MLDELAFDIVAAADFANEMPRLNEGELDVPPRSGGGALGCPEEEEDDELPAPTVMLFAAVLKEEIPAALPTAEELASTLDIGFVPKDK